MMDEELEDLVRGRLLQAAVWCVGLMSACALVGWGLSTVRPLLRGGSGAARIAAARVPEAVRGAAETAIDAAATVVTAVKDGWRAGGEQ